MNGFQGLTGAFPVAARQVLAGPNGAGKSRMLRAVGFALTGADPALGKKASNDLCTGRKGLAGVAIDDDGRELAVERLYERDGDSVTRSVKITPPLKEKSARAAEEWILKNLGDCAAMLDLGEFEGLTPGKRADYLSGLIGAAEGSTITVADLVKAITEAAETEIDTALLSKIKSAWNPRGTIAANLEAVMLTIGQALTETAAAEKEAEAALRRTVDELGTIQAPSESAADLRDQRAKLQEQAEKARAEIAADEERKNAIDAANRDLGTAKGDHAALLAKSEGIKAAVTNAAKVLEEASAALVAAEAEEQPKPIDTKDWEGTARVNELKTRLDDAIGAAGRARTEAVNLRDKGAGFVAGVGSCPVSEGLTCPAQKDVATAIDQKVRGLELRVEMLDKSEAAIRAEFSEAVRRRDDMERALLDAEGKRVMASLDWSKRVKALRENVASATRTKGAAEIALGRHESALEAAKKAEKAAQKRIDELPGTIDVADMRRQLDTLRASIVDYDGPTGKIARVEKARTLNEQRIKRESEQSAAHDRAKAYRAIQGAAKRTAGVILANALGPLTRTVDGLLSSVRPGWRLIVAAEGGGVVLKADAGRGEQPWALLSGGEGIVFSAALALALVRLRNPPLKVLLLEAAELDAVNLLRLLSALSAMGKDFGTIIVASCHAHEIDSLDGEWSILNLGATAEARS